MRIFIILAAVILAGSTSFIASAENASGFSLKKPEAKTDLASPHSRCAKKIPLGPDRREVGCLMRKRTGRPER